RSVSKPRYIWWGYVKAAIHACGNVKNPKHKYVTDDISAAYARMYDSLDEPKKQLCQMVLVKRTHTIAGAALQLHISEATARRWHWEVITKMAHEMKLSFESH